MSEEIWELFPLELELSSYSISSKGRIFDIKKEALVLAKTRSAGIRIYTLRQDDNTVSRYCASLLVSEAFKMQGSENEHVLQIQSRTGAIVKIWNDQKEVLYNNVDMCASTLMKCMNQRFVYKGCLWVPTLPFNGGKELRRYEWVKPILPERKKKGLVKKFHEFEVCKEGLIKNHVGIVSRGAMKNDYYTLQNIRVHRIICLTFNGPPPDPKTKYVHHKNRVKTDNRASNLEWKDGSEICSNERRNKLLLNPLQNLNKPCKVTAFSVTDLTKQGSFLSISEAISEMQKLGIRVYCASISNCLKGKSLTTGGFYWRETNESEFKDVLEVSEEEKKKVNKAAKKTVYVYSKETHLPVGKPFNTQADCADKKQIASSALLRSYISGKNFPPGDVYYTHDPPLPPEAQGKKFNQLFPNLPEQRISKNRLLDTKVVMIDRSTFKVIKTMKIQEACDWINENKTRTNSVEPGDISRCFRGKKRSLGGYCWMRKEEYDEKGTTNFKKGPNWSRKILKTSLSGQIIESYNGMKECHKKNSKYYEFEPLRQKVVLGKLAIIKGKDESDFYLQFEQSDVRPPPKKRKQKEGDPYYICYSLEGRKLASNQNLRTLVETVLSEDKLLETEAAKKMKQVDSYINAVRSCFRENRSFAKKYQWHKVATEEEIPKTFTSRDPNLKSKRVKRK